MVEFRFLSVKISQDILFEQRKNIKIEQDTNTPD